MSFETTTHQAIDGSRIEISELPVRGGAEYKSRQNSIFLFVLLSNFNGEKVIIRYHGKRISVPIDEFYSEIIEHEFLHMLLGWFVDWMTCLCLDNIDNILRVDFYDKFLEATV